MNQKKLRASHEGPASIPLRSHAPDARAPRRSSDPIIFSIRGSEAWRDWLKRFAAHRRITPTALIDQILAETARRDGFASPPPRCSNAPGGRDDARRIP